MKTSSFKKQIIKTFSSKRDIFMTPKYKIYKESRMVYNHNNEYILQLTKEQWLILMLVKKHPGLIYKKKMDILIDGYPNSFAKFVEKKIYKSN